MQFVRIEATGNMSRSIYKFTENPLDICRKIYDCPMFTVLMTRVIKKDTQPLDEVQSTDLLYKTFLKRCKKEEFVSEVASAVFECRVRGVNVSVTVSFENNILKIVSESLSVVPVVEDILNLEH